ncbi:HD domain-containing protein [Pseudodesulfovibrio indicus]|uniref:HD domain-containing protein n=1 Tax=Pseudodesulfovibrio indicus TaxID=1716143 RepID=UPI00292EA3C3|nr:HD domain-containing protein [Pseudodesulfovibrio indicus]
MESLERHCLKWLLAFAREHRDRTGGELRGLIQRKITHTMRVLAHARHILDELRPAPDLRCAAEIAAILHDTARFPQLERRATFDDHAGYNHAVEGARILAGTDLLDPLGEKWRGVVLTAVRLHNLSVLPTDLTGEERTVTELLRDADKLDAIRNNLRHMDPKTLHGKALKSGLTWHETEVSPEVVRLTLDRQLIPFQSIKWSNDFILFLCNWLHDLHFPYPYRFLDRTGQFEELLGWLPDSGPFPEIKAQLRADLAQAVRG